VKGETTTAAMTTAEASRLTSGQRVTWNKFRTGTVMRNYRYASSVAVEWDDGEFGVIPYDYCQPMSLVGEASGQSSSPLQRCRRLGAA